MVLLSPLYYHQCRQWINAGTNNTNVNIRVNGTIAFKWRFRRSVVTGHVAIQTKFFIEERSVNPFQAVRYMAIG